MNVTGTTETVEDVLNIFLLAVLLQREDVEFIIIYGLCVVMHWWEGREMGCILFQQPVGLIPAGVQPGQVTPKQCWKPLWNKLLLSSVLGEEGERLFTELFSLEHSQIHFETWIGAERQLYNFILISVRKFANVSAFHFIFFLAFFVNLCRNSFFPTATLLRVCVWSVVLSKIMANYSVKNFLFWGLFSPLLSTVSQGEISSSFDFTPSQPSFHQDMPRNLKGAVSAKRSL